jgi:hypothetical protein
MNTATHTVEVPFPQAFASRDQEARFRVPPGTGVSQGQPDLPERVLRSNQTVRCDECASIQRRMKFSRCVLALCDLAKFLCSGSILYRQDGICQAGRAHETNEHLLHRHTHRTAEGTGSKRGGFRCTTYSTRRRCFSGMQQSYAHPIENTVLPCLSQMNYNGTTLVPEPILRGNNVH